MTEIVVNGVSTRKVSRAIESFAERVCLNLLSQRFVKI